MFKIFEIFGTHIRNFDIKYLKAKIVEMFQYIQKLH